MKFYKITKYIKGSEQKSKQIPNVSSNERVSLVKKANARADDMLTFSLTTSGFRYTSDYGDYEVLDRLEYSVASTIPEFSENFSEGPIWGV